MKAISQFSLRLEPGLVKKIDEVAELRYKTRSELIKEAVLNYLEQYTLKERLKKIAAELWLKGEISKSELKKVLNEEEIADLEFGKRWIEKALGLG